MSTYEDDPNSLADNHNNIPIDDGVEILYCIFHILGAFILGILLLIHGFKTYQDLYTRDRKSLDHRRKKPSIDIWYKAASWFTCLHIFGNFMSLVFFSILYTSVSFCYWPLVAGVFFYFLAKGHLYCVFFIRLHQVYGESAYGYNKKIIIGLIFIVHAFIIYNTSIFFTNKYDIVYFYDNDGKIPEYCIGILFIANIIVTLQDIIFTIGSMIAFLVPLRRTIKMMGDNINEKVEAKMVFIGTKVAILSTAATISTIIFLGIIIISNATLLQAVDEIMNAVCLMFMTPYYPDSKYYQKFCCLCILCCDRKHRSYESQASGDNRNNTNKENEPTADPSSIKLSETGQTQTLEADTKSIASSVDTMDQIEIVAKQTKVNDKQLLSDSEI